MEQLVEGHLLPVVGVAVTLAAFSFLAGVIWTLTWSDDKLHARKIRPSVRKVETPQAGDEVNDEVVAVIAAAATAVMRKRVTIKRITFLSPAPGQAWTVTGRLNIMASHAITKRKTTS
jgi:Na+-transporting methylmalonyl-CoA/oxaloacetate decarboxylase gamma subunit